MFQPKLTPNPHKIADEKVTTDRDQKGRFLQIHIDICQFRQAGYVQTPLVHYLRGQ